MVNFDYAPDIISSYWEFVTVSVHPKPVQFLPNDSLDLNRKRFSDSLFDGAAFEDTPMSDLGELPDVGEVLDCFGGASNQTDPFVKPPTPGWNSVESLDGLPLVSGVQANSSNLD